MCTVTFSPRRHGYALAMNRDEKLSRVRGLPPSKKVINGRAVLAPSEPGGGTWIALNDCGATFALINWYSMVARVTGESISRGKVVNATSSATTPEIAELAVRKLRLKQINPFRLIGIFSATKKIVEWHWDLKTLVRTEHRWLAQQWISSGFDEPTAQRTRSQAFRKAIKQKSAGSLNWLWRLHRSHVPQAGPFSTCMHRGDAATVSCTQVAVTPSRRIMRYYDGALCHCGSSDSQSHFLSFKK